MFTARRIQFVTLLLGFLVFAIAIVSFRRREPSHEGKPLSRWLRGLEYENVNPTEAQRQAFRAMGEPAVKCLIEILQHRDWYLKRKFVTYAETHPDIHNRF